MEDFRGNFVEIFINGQSFRSNDVVSMLLIAIINIVTHMVVGVSMMILIVEFPWRFSHATNSPRLLFLLNERSSSAAAFSLFSHSTHLLNIIPNPIASLLLFNINYSYSFIFYHGFPLLLLSQIQQDS